MKKPARYIVIEELTGVVVNVLNVKDETMWPMPAVGHIIKKDNEHRYGSYYATDVSESLKELITIDNNKD